MCIDHSPKLLWNVAAGEALPLGSVLRRLAGAQLRQAAAESALSPGELVGSRTTGPPYFALKPTSEHSAVAVVAVGLAVVAVVLAVADVVLAVAESVSAVTAYLLRQHSGAQRPRPGPAGRGL